MGGGAYKGGRLQPRELSGDGIFGWGSERTWEVKDALWYRGLAVCLWEPREGNGLLQAESPSSIASPPHLRRGQQLWHVIFSPRAHPRSNPPNFRCVHHQSRALGRMARRALSETRPRTSTQTQHRTDKPPPTRVCMHLAHSRSRHAATAAFSFSAFLLVCFAVKYRGRPVT